MGPDNADADPGGRDDQRRRHDLAGRPRPALQHVPRAERKALQKFIQGNATVYAGKGKLANRAYKFLNPALSTSQRLFDELSQRLARAAALPRDGRQDLRRDRRPARRPRRAWSATATSAAGGRQPEHALDPLAATLRPTRCARRTRPSSTCARPSTTSTRSSPPPTRRPRTWPRSCAASRPSRPTAAPSSGTSPTSPGCPAPTTTSPTRCKLLPRRRSAGNTAFPAAVKAMNASQDNFAFIARPTRRTCSGCSPSSARRRPTTTPTATTRASRRRRRNIFDYDARHQELEPDLQRARAAAVRRARLRHLPPLPRRRHAARRRRLQPVPRRRRARDRRLRSHRRPAGGP